MLKALKQDLIQREQAISPVELMLESVVNDDVRDSFLDNAEAAILGSENDPEVAKQVEKIPEAEDFELTDDEMDELNTLEESISTIPYFY